MDIKAWIDSIGVLAQEVGLPRFGVVAAVMWAVGLRFLRAGFPWFNSGAMYLATIPLAWAVAFTSWFGGPAEIPGGAAMAFAGVALSIQRLLQAVPSIPNVPDWVKRIFPEDLKPEPNPEPPKEV